MPVGKWLRDNPALGRLLLLLLVVAVGYAAASLSHLSYSTSSGWYRHLAYALLAAGLFGSAYGIGREVRDHLGTVLAAITVGVVVKAAIITGLFWLFFDGRVAVALVLALVVTQIDPLSVAALQRHSRLSDRGKTILSAWASFDDPITILCSIYAVGFLIDSDRAKEVGLPGDLTGFIVGLGANALLIAGAALLWYPGRALVKQWKHRPWARQAGFFAALVVLVVILGIGAWFGLFLGLAITALFFRPKTDRLFRKRPAPEQQFIEIGTAVERVTTLALTVATILLGTLLVGGVDLLHGAVLGAAAFLAQVIVGPVIAWRLSWGDRRRLARAQQNGITSIVLALSLQPVVPDVIKIVAPAILTINVLHILTNLRFDRREESRLSDEPTPESASAGSATSHEHGDELQHVAGFVVAPLRFVRRRRRSWAQ